MTIEEWAKDFKSFVNELQMPRDDYKGIMEYIDDAIALLKERKGLMLALGQSNAVNGYLNAEVERLNGLLKEQEDALEQMRLDNTDLRNCNAELMKEQGNEKKRIMKVIWDTLHEGLSIDTVADQDWVFERIRHQIEDT